MTVAAPVPPQRKPYRSDLYVVTVSVMLVLAIFAYIDLPKEAPELWLLSYPINGNEPGGPGAPGGGPVIAEETVVSESGHTAEGGSTDVAFAAPWTVVRWVNATLTWTDDVGSNDELGLGLLNEGTELDSTSGTSGELSLSIKDPPGGNYTVQVSAIDCPGRITSHPFDQDTGNDWGLVVLVVYEEEE